MHDIERLSEQDRGLRISAYSEVTQTSIPSTSTSSLPVSPSPVTPLSSLNIGRRWVWSLVRTSLQFSLRKCRTGTENEAGVCDWWVESGVYLSSSGAERIIVRGILVTLVDSVV